MGNGRETRVELASLMRSGQMLGAVAEDLGFSFQRIEGLRSRALGSRRIDGALNHFADHWKFGWGVMEEKLKATGAQLAAAARQYEEVEAAMAQTFLPPKP
jgi:hypothetical protein